MGISIPGANRVALEKDIPEELISNLLNANKVPKVDRATSIQEDVLAVTLNSVSTFRAITESILAPANVPPPPPVVLSLG